jgi:hypothetical protein
MKTFQIIEAKARPGYKNEEGEYVAPTGLGGFFEGVAKGVSGNEGGYSGIAGVDAYNAKQRGIADKEYWRQLRLKQKQMGLGNEFFEVPDNSGYDGKYVLVPSSGNFDHIHRYITCFLNNDQNCID